MEREVKREQKDRETRREKEEKGTVIDESMLVSKEFTSKSISQLTVAVGDWQLDRSALFIRKICGSCPSNMMK